MLPPGEIVLVVFAHFPALHQEVVGVVKVGRDFHTLAAILIAGDG